MAVIGVDALPESTRAAAVEGVALGVHLGGYEDVRFKSEVSVPPALWRPALTKKSVGYRRWIFLDKLAPAIESEVRPCPPRDVRL